MAFAFFLIYYLLTPFPNLSLWPGVKDIEMNQS